jgi:hypothetical protein
MPGIGLAWMASLTPDLLTYPGEKAESGVRNIATL